MSDPTLSADALQFVNFLHRGGAYGYFWGVQGAHKITRWFPVGQPAALFNTRHNNYFGVNPTTASGTQYQRAKKGERDIAAVNCLYAEFDSKDYGSKDAILAHIQTLEACTIAPSVIIDSGGGFHVYWLLKDPFVLATDEARARADLAQEGWVRFVGGDGGAKDLARPLRIPGTLNFKYDPPRPVEIIQADYRLLYTFDELESLLPPAPVPKTRAPKTAGATAGGIQDETGDADFDTIADAARNLKRLAAWRRDDYDPWYRVGMALRELGSIGFELWEKWSKLSAKYQPGDCRDKWQTFKPGDECNGITLASLALWARIDDPQGPATAAGDVVPRADYDRVKAERDELKQRVIWEQQILNVDGLKPTEKGVFVGMYDIIAAHRHLGGNAGRIPLSYEHVADVLKTSKSTVGRAVEIGEQIGLWRRDPEHTTGANGVDLLHMRLELQPAYDDPKQAISVARKQQGGARQGAGRKPKCPDCPPGTVHRQIIERIASYYCPIHGLLATEELPALVEDYMPETENQDETGNDPPVYQPGEVWTAVWAAKDVDEPVTVIGIMGELDGRIYYIIEESATGIPADEVRLLERRSTPAAVPSEPHDGTQREMVTTVPNMPAEIQDETGSVPADKPDYRQAPVYPPGYVADMLERLRQRPAEAPA
jgi:hypothetical protein